ncbi:MAG: CARDB domain-containing protein [Thermodesulfobacteriota bacterium]
MTKRSKVSFIYILSLLLTIGFLSLSTPAFGATLLIDHNVPFSGVPMAPTGGTPNYTWAVTSDALPPGLNLVPAGDTKSAVISGTPTTPGHYCFTVTVTDSVAPPVSKEFPTCITVEGYGLCDAVDGISGPDILVTTFTVPESVKADHLTKFPVTIKNQGDTDADYFSSFIYLSTDDKFQGEHADHAQSAEHPEHDEHDALKDIIFNAGGLDSGQCYYTAASFILPEESGDYYIIAIVDPSKNVTEGINGANENNNEKVSEAFAVIGGDLIITELIVPEEVIIGEEFTVSSKVKNIGKGEIGESHLQYYASEDLTIDITDLPLIGGSRRVPSLEGETEENEPFVSKVTIPFQDKRDTPYTKTVMGRYYIGAIVDYPKAVPELRENNNTKIILPKTEVSYGVDFYITSITSSVNSYIGGGVRVRVNVENLGTVDPPDGGTNVEVWLKRDNGRDINLGSIKIFNQSLGTNVESVLKIDEVDLHNAPNPDLKNEPGTYKIWGKVDPGNAILETNEKNNEAEGNQVNVGQ